VIHVPVTFETYGISGACSDARDSSLANSASTGSIMAEWNAWEVASRFVATERDASACSSEAIASVGPETTHSWGALTAAMERGRPAVAERTSASLIGTASIAPGSCACIRRARIATSRSAVSSENTPARQAATYSPRLWPIIACGRIPQLIQSRAIAYSTTKSAGWVMAVCPSSAAAASRFSGCG
jgi:hypothetical protein